MITFSQVDWQAERYLTHKYIKCNKENLILIQNTPFPRSLPLSLTFYFLHARLLPYFHHQNNNTLLLHIL